MLTEENHATRTATEVWNDARRRSQTHFVHQVCDDLLDGVRAYPLVPGELPKHDIVMTSEGPDAMLERFKREPDMLASFLPDGFAAVDKALLIKMMKMLTDAIPIATQPGQFGPISGADQAEMVLRMSADRLYGMSEVARRQYADAQNNTGRVRT